MKIKKILKVLLILICFTFIKDVKALDNEETLIENIVVENVSSVESPKVTEDTSLKNETKMNEEVEVLTLEEEEEVAEFSWNANKVTPTVTSEGLIVTPAYDGYQNGIYNFTLTYEIPSTFKEETLIINPDVFEILAWGQGTDVPLSMPGDTIKVKVTIINNSNYKYNYEENSFIVYPDNELEYDKISEDEVLFNQEAPTELNTYKRVYNEALVSLLNSKNSLISDEVIEPLLIELGYEGISSLGDYYLDFYNSLFETNNTSLEQFTKDQITRILRIYGSSKKSFTETCDKLIALHFGFFYNELLSVGVGDDVLTDKNSSEYSVGEYMRDESKGDEQIKESFETLDKGSTNEIDITTHFNGPNMGNAYANYTFMAHMHMSFKAVKGTLIVKYVDESGNLLSEEIITEELPGTSYETLEKVFDNYELKDIVGEKEGFYTDEIVEVTYIYKLKELEKPVINPVSNIPNTGLFYNNDNIYYLTTSILLLLLTITFRKKILSR